jgi:predicted dehydrogenase
VLAGATVSRLSAGLDVEDYAAVLLRGGGATCLVETGYLLPAATAVFDLHYSIRTERHYFIVRDPTTLEIVNHARQIRVVAMPTVNVPLYPAFVADTLRRVSRGDPPVADLHDMAAAMQLVEQAYRVNDSAGL